MSLDVDEPDQTGPQRATFIVRMVRERRQGSTWRGEVEHVQHGERRPASDPAAALAHVTEWLATLLPPSAHHVPRPEDAPSFESTGGSGTRGRRKDKRA